MTPDPSDPTPPEEPARPDGPRDRLRRALRPGHASRGQVVAGVLLAALGFAGVTQVRATNQDDRFTAASQQDLIAFITTLNLATDRAENELAQLQRTRQSLRDDAQASGTALELARRQADTLGILAGTLPATGPGVRITVEDPSGSVGTDQLVEGIQELRDAGAEAIEVNDRVRVVAQTGVVDGDTGLVIGGTAVEPPYVIEAIGSPAGLATGLDFRGSFVDDVRTVGGTISVKQEDSLEITAVVDPGAPEYAEPVPGQ